MIHATGALLHQMEQKDYVIFSAGETSLWTQLKAMFALIPNQSPNTGLHSACDQHQPHPTWAVIFPPCTQTAAELQYPTGNPDATTVDAEEIRRKGRVAWLTRFYYIAAGD